MAIIDRWFAVGRSGVIEPTRSALVDREELLGPLNRRRPESELTGRHWQSNTRPAVLDRVT
jgi:hypothetical protein